MFRSNTPFCFQTVQMLALIVANPRKIPKELKIIDGKEQEKPPKGTLIVGPLALIEQWHSEIKNKVDRNLGLRVLMYHGPDRTKSTCFTERTKSLLSNSSHHCADPRKIAKYDIGKS